MYKLTITKALTGLKKKEFSATELTQACLDRIEATDKELNTFITVTKELALEQATRADKLLAEKSAQAFEEKPLLGIPMAVKDNYCTQGIRTTAASKVLESFVPPYSATAYKNLEEAGAILVGKTNMDAWAHGSSTEASDFFTTKNPHDPSRLPGGSSGGSAAAVAANEAIFAVGTETAGSIRQPAAWCGVVGMKPTYGRVSRYGIIAMCSSTDSPGPLTKTVADAAAVFQVMAGHDPLDATSSSAAVSEIKLVGGGLEGLKVGVPKEYFEIKLERGVQAAVEKALDVYRELGIEVKEISLLSPKYSIAVYTVVQRAEVSSNLARYDGIRFGSDRSAFGEEAKRRIMLGTYTLSAGYYDQYYAKAQQVRNLLTRDFEEAFGEVDVIIAPTSPSVALPIGSSEGEAMFGELQDVLVEASSLAGLPGISIPCGFSQGLPVGMQIVAPQFREDLVFQMAYAYEQAN